MHNSKTRYIFLSEFFFYMKNNNLFDIKWKKNVLSDYQITSNSTSLQIICGHPPHIIKCDNALKSRLTLFVHMS